MTMQLLDKVNTANNSGKTLENTAKAILREHRISYHPQWNTKQIDHFGYEIKVDFYLPDVENGIYIECRRQESAGSADQKCSHIFVRIQRGCYDKPVIVLMAGEHTQAVYRFFKNEENRHMRCMDLAEFMKFCEACSAGSSPISRSYYADQMELF